MTSLYGNIGGAQKSIASAFSNVSGTQKQIFPYTYIWNKYNTNQSSGYVEKTSSISSTDCYWTYTYGYGFSSYTIDQTNGLFVISDPTFYSNSLNDLSQNRLVRVTSLEYCALYTSDSLTDVDSLDGTTIKTGVIYRNTSSGYKFAAMNDYIYCVPSSNSSSSGTAGKINFYSITLESGTMYSCGSYITRVSSSSSSTYPSNGRHSDGYWYIYQGRV